MATRAATLTQAPEKRRAIAGVLSAVDHKTIGLRFMITGFLFFCLAGIEALFIRGQLSAPENAFLSPDVYNQLFTMHGTTMIFFFATPVLFGLGNFFIPLMIGAREMAFPRLNAFSYWVFLFSGLFMSSSLLVGMAPNGGWYTYPPLVSTQYSPGLNLDFWSLGLIFLSIATLAAAINFIATLLTGRAPEMSMNRMPLFAWAIFITSCIVIFALPPLDAANLFLTLERKFGFHFFQSLSGGNPLLWQQLFWVFGHPSFYILFLPAAGIVSEVTGAFSRRPVLGYTLIIWSLAAIGVIGFGMWAVHLFATGISAATEVFASIAGALVSIPSGILVFAWLGTLLTGRPVWKTPLLWTGGFIFLFVAGGLTGVMLAVPPFDRLVTDSYFVTAHFHAMLIGGMVFPLFAGFYYWFPRFSGRMLNERLGRAHFWLFFTGSLLVAVPMFILGLAGMPRHVYTYQPVSGWEGLNLVVTIGAFVIAEGVLVFIVNVIASLSRGDIAGSNPWDAGTLEWAVASLPETPQAPASLMPISLAAALLVVFIGLLLSQYWLAVAGAVLSMILIFIWLWPSHPEGETA